MQTEIDTMLVEFIDLWLLFSGFVVMVLVLSWHLMHKRTGRTMTQRRYSATIMVLSAVTTPLVMLLPLGVMAVNHPSSVAAFVGYLIAERLFYFVYLLLYVLVAVTGGWVFARLYPSGETHESQSESHPEPVEKPASP
jgi:hypothetical protein